MRPYTFALLAVVVADLDDCAGISIELHSYLDACTVPDRLSVIVKISQIRRGSNCVAEALGTDPEVDHPIRAHRSFRNALKHHAAFIVTAVNVPNFRRCETAIGIRRCLYLDTGIDPRQ